MQPVLYLAEYWTGNLFFTRTKRDLLERFHRSFNRQRCVFSDAAAANAHRQRVGTKPPPVALTANRRRHQLFESDSYLFGGRFVQPIAQPTERALPLVLVTVKPLTKL